MAEMNCGNCRFWVHRIPQSVLGECHGGPPTARPEAQLKGRWPKTEANDWCGQWKARADATN